MLKSRSQRALGRRLGWIPRVGREDIMDYSGALSETQTPLRLVNNAPVDGIFCTWREGHAKRYFLLNPETGDYVPLRNGDDNPIHPELVFSDIGRGEWVSKSKYRTENRKASDDRGSTAETSQFPTASRITSLENLVHQLSERLERVEQERDALHEIRDSLHRSLKDDLRHAPAHSELAHADIIERLDDLEERSEKLERENRALERENNALERENKTLSARLDMLKEQHDTLAASSFNALEVVNAKQQTVQKEICEEVKVIMALKVATVLEDSAKMFADASKSLNEKHREAAEAIVDLRAQVKQVQEGVAHVVPEISGLAGRVDNVETSVEQSMKSVDSLGRRTDGMNDGLQSIQRKLIKHRDSQNDAVQKLEQSVAERFSIVDNSLCMIRRNANDTIEQPAPPGVPQSVVDDMTKKLDDTEKALVEINKTIDSLRKTRLMELAADQESVLTHMRELRAALEGLVPDVQKAMEAVENHNGQMEALQKRLGETQQEAWNAGWAAFHTQESFAKEREVWTKSMQTQKDASELLVTRVNKLERDVEQYAIMIDTLLKYTQNSQSDHLEALASHIHLAVDSELDGRWHTLERLVKQEAEKLKEEIQPAVDLAELAFGSGGHAARR
ncbi:hypothetical protein CALVIDRAFT_602934 [Calocera viscosa TUFC12733]|uniref:Uncharacterized protein n=1 Tax=Calocera viscosa (strain TUFC12733) TaxID=1330018 RepID=A0A167GEH7_CALVF|nr:hypothetical protein CALVIDRAFT_602934 [Calocera viscosa TUFC12733]